MKEGDIALAIISQSDSKNKLRPVLLLRKMPGYSDFLVCGISSQLQQEIKDFDLILSEADSGFSSTGLKCSSLVRLSFLGIVPSSEIAGVLGTVSFNSLSTLQQRLSGYLINPD